ncbi:hypothetical protein GWI33_003716, partial [Rhynchophorus ferrugineus]
HILTQFNGLTCNLTRYEEISKFVAKTYLRMWLFLIIGALAVAYSIACPDGCSCDLEIIDCMGLDLSNLPEGIDIN